MHSGAAFATLRAGIAPARAGKKGDRAIKEPRTPGAGDSALSLYGARALSAVDSRGGETAAFAEGLALLESLPLETRSIEHVLHDAVRLGALADPVSAIALLRRLPADHLRHSSGATLVQTLAQSGDFESALGLLEDLSCEAGGAQILVHLASDPAIQLRAMAAARARWRAFREGPDSHFTQQEFYHLFSRHWRKIPANEQEGWVDEILQALESGPDHPTNAGFGQHVEFHRRAMRTCSKF